jgi:hypothetical protein
VVFGWLIARGGRYGDGTRGRGVDGNGDLGVCGRSWGVGYIHSSRLRARISLLVSIPE